MSDSNFEQIWSIRKPILNLSKTFSNYVWITGRRLGANHFENWKIFVNFLDRSKYSKNQQKARVPIPIFDLGEILLRPFRKISGSNGFWILEFILIMKSTNTNHVIAAFKAELKIVVVKLSYFGLKSIFSKKSNFFTKDFVA